MNGIKAKFIKSMLFLVFVFFLSVILFNQEASAASPSITMLSTKTCPACAQMEKVFKDINVKYRGKISTEHIYLEDNPDVAKKYNVRYVPTLIFKNSAGKEVAQEVGYRSVDEILNIFSKAGVKFN